jgi:hypothetical protein
MTESPPVLKLNARDRRLVSTDLSVMLGDRLVLTFRIEQSSLSFPSCPLYCHGILLSTKKSYNDNGTVKVKRRFSLVTTAIPTIVD